VRAHVTIFSYYGYAVVEINGIRLFLVHTEDPSVIDPSFWKYDAGMWFFPKDEKWRVGLVGRNLTNEITANYLGQVPFTGASASNGTVSGVTPADIHSFVMRPREIWLQAERWF